MTDEQRSGNRFSVYHGEVQIGFDAKDATVTAVTNVVMNIQVGDSYAGIEARVSRALLSNMTMDLLNRAADSIVRDIEGKLNGKCPDEEERGEPGVTLG